MTPVDIPGYRIDAEPLGDGRHGKLLAGVRRSDGAAVAVEVVEVGPETAGTLAAEAAALRDLPESPQLLPVLDVGVGAGAGSAWLVSPRPERTLADGPGLTADAAGRVLTDAALGLTALHGGGFVHGALAPAALAELANGRVALWGFAVPVLAERDDGPHRPPEIRRGAEWSVTADLWALGSAVRALTAGTALSPQLVDLLDDLLADDPADRPQSAQSVVERLRPASAAHDPLLTAGPSRPVATSPGRPLGSGYLLDEPIGRGATGQVWRGRRRSDNTQVAVKVLRSELAEDPEVVARFLAERTTLTGLSSPHLVRVLDLVAESGTLALVMELVDGDDLRHALASGRLSTADGMRVLAQVAEGLGAVHAAGVVHRDLKPENVLVGRDGGTVGEAGAGTVHAWLTDFGVARAATAPGGSRLTRTSRLVGTPEYVAPELAAGRPATGAADIYALGVLAYEVLSGRRPFDADHPAALLRAHLEDAPTRPDGLSDDAWTVISACLAKEPDDRPDATRAAAALLALVGSEPAGVALGALPASGDAMTPPPYLSPAAPVGAEALLTAGASVAAPEAPPEPAPVKSRRQLWVALGAVLVLVVVGVAAGVWAGRPDGSHATPTGSPKPKTFTGGVQIPVVADSPERGSIRLRFPSGPSVPGVQSFFVIRDVGLARQNIAASADEWTQTGLDPKTAHCWRVFALVESATPIPTASPQAKTCLRADGSRS